MEMFIYIFAIALCLFHLTFFIPWRSALRGTRKLCAALGSGARTQMFATNKVAYDLAPKVRAQVRARRWKSWQSFLRVGRHFPLIGVAVRLAIVARAAREGSDLDGIKENLLMMCVVHFIAMLLCLLLDAAEWLRAAEELTFLGRTWRKPFERFQLGSWVVAVAYFGLQGLGWGLPFVRSSDTINLSHFFMIWVNIVHRTTSHAVLSACIGGGATIYLEAYSGLRRGECALTARNIWFNQALFCLILVTFTWILDRLTFAEALSATRAENDGAALSTILNASCDVVVKVDEELCILGGTNKLAVMLFRSPNDLDGAKLTSLVPEADHGQLWEALLEAEKPSADRERMASAIQLDMLDSRGGTVRFSGFHTRVVEVEGSVTRVLGLSEMQHGDDRVPMLEENSPNAPGNSAIGSSCSYRYVTRCPSRHSNASSSVPDSHNDAEERRACAGDLRERGEALQSLLLRWDVAVPPGSCCAFHEALIESVDVIYAMQRWPCAHASQASARKAAASSSGDGSTQCSSHPGCALAL